MFSEDPILLPEIVDQIVLVTVHPASEREDEELQRRRHSLRLLGRLDQHRPSLGRFFAPYGDADSEREILDDFWPDLFAAMVNCWLTDEQQWPKNRTHQMFGEWFDLQMCPVVEDLHLDEELVELD